MPEGSELVDFAELMVDPQAEGGSGQNVDWNWSPTQMGPGGGGGGLPAPTPSSFWSDLVGGASKEFTQSPLSSFAKGLGLAGTGLNIANSMNLSGQVGKATKGVQQAQQQAQAAAAPAVEFGTSTLKSAQAGQLPAPMQAAVQQWIEQSKAAMRQQYASMGQSKSSNLASEEAKIDLMAKSMIAQLLQGQEGLALQGLQTGVSAAAGGGQLAQQQQQMLMNLIASANQQLGHLGSNS